jgi:DUF1680 family protein
MRFLATFPDQLATVDADGIQLHQFATGTIETRIADAPVALAIGTDYPWDGEIDVTVTESPATPWTLSIRIPGWCPDATVMLDGSTVLVESGPGYTHLTRTWRHGERVVVRVPLHPRITTPDQRIDALRGTVALERGPLVYAVEDADLPGQASIESLEVDPELHIRPVADGVPGDAGGVRLEFEAVIRDDAPSDAWPYASRAAGSPPARGKGATVVHVGALPYFAWAQRDGLGMRVWLPTRSGPRSEADSATGGA